jgi:pyruvate dehydrogenase E1 component beta subunit
MSAPIRTTLRRIVAEHPSVHILGEAVELSPTTTGLMGAHPDRVHLLPAADATLVGTAVGMALTGAQPIVELSGGPALWGALQQLAQEAAALTGDEYAVPVVARVPLAPGESAPLDLLAHIDGLTVAVAGSADDAAELLEAALSVRGPVVLFEPAEAMSRSGGSGGLALGRAHKLRDGDHVSLLALGAGVGAALKAADALSQQGISADVVDLRTLSPLDVETVGASIRHTGRAVFVGTSAGSVTTAIEAAFLRLESPPRTAAPNVEAIASAVHAALSY